MKKINSQIARFAMLVLNTFLLVNMLFISSCEKGETGPSGADGTNGISKIQSFTFTVNNASWVYDSTFNGYNSILNVSSITADVFNNGTIQVFIGDGSSNQWGALPSSFNIYQYNYIYKIGEVVLSVRTSVGVLPNIPSSQQFKVVVIPPSAKVANVNLQNYAEVKAAYNLKDSQ